MERTSASAATLLSCSAAGQASERGRPSGEHKSARISAAPCQRAGRRVELKTDAAAIEWPSRDFWQTLWASCCLHHRQTSLCLCCKHLDGAENERRALNKLDDIRTTISKIIARCYLLSIWRADWGPVSWNKLGACFLFWPPPQAARQPTGRGGRNAGGSSPLVRGQLQLLGQLDLT